MTSGRDEHQPGGHDPERTAQTLRLVQAFTSLKSRALREALLVLAEHLEAAQHRLR